MKTHIIMFLENGKLLRLWIWILSYHSVTDVLMTVIFLAVCVTLFILIILISGWCFNKWGNRGTLGQKNSDWYKFLIKKNYLDNFLLDSWHISNIILRGDLNSLNELMILEDWPIVPRCLNYCAQVTLHEKDKKKQ